MASKIVCWAGDLFELKDLISARFLADAFERQASGRWIADHPQLGLQIVHALDRCATMPLIAKTPEDAFFAFKHAVRSAGGTIPERFRDCRIREIIEARFAGKLGISPNK